MNISKNYLLYLVLFVFVIFFLPVFSFAQTNVNDVVTDTAQKIIKDKFDSETGLDKVKDFTDINAGKIADEAVKSARGDAPSALMAELISQMRDVQNTGLSNNFRLYTKKKPFNTKNACNRIANQRMVEGLDNANVKAQLTPWVDISWEAIKGIASGGKSLGDLIKENTKKKIEEIIKTTLFGKSEQKIETVVIPSYDSCGSVTKITWDPKNMRIIVATKGDCLCKLYPGDGVEKGTLKDYKVVIVAPVTVKNVKIEEENYFIFWKKYNIKAQYKVGKLKVATDANCNCNGDISLPPPPKNESTVEENGFFGGIWNWIFGDEDKVEEPKDETLPPEDEGIKDESEKDKEETPKEISGIPAFIDWLFGRDKEIGEGDSIKDTTNPKEPKKEKDEKPLVCGEVVSVDGRDNVQTFVFRDSSSQNVNFDCDSSCKPGQICKILSQSVGAYKDSCVYCANKEEYIPEPEKEESTSKKCEIPSNQKWNNVMLGFKFTVLDDRRVLFENSRTYCGMSSLEEFKETAEASMRFLSCPVIKLDDYKYTDIRGSCSFIAYFAN